jgi:hypothetical protein
VAKKQEVSSRKTKAKSKVVKPSKVANRQVAGGEMTEQNKKTGSPAASVLRGLSSDRIGQTAGDVWRVLAERGGQTVAGVKKSIDAPDDVVLLALGWLAREDKLTFETNGRSVTVSLR